MKLSKKEFIEKLNKEAKNIQVELDEKQLEQLYMYKQLLVEWNEKINLTTIVDDEEIIAKHIIDSLVCVKYVKSGERVIDVGTGAGLPGVIIAIYFNGEVNVTLFDALNKRIIFLNEVIDMLELKNTITIHGRAEEITNTKEYREKYDVAVSRAVARLNILMELTAPFVKNGGSCIYMKSEKAGEEMLKTKNAEKVLNISLVNKDEYTINCSDERIIHNILLYKKENTINEKYPRQYSKIKKSPL